MPESGTNTALLGFIALVAIAILLAVTNPSEKAHRQSISAEFQSKRPLADAVGLGVVDSLLPEYQSAVFYSSTRESNEITSIGALGMVWVVEIEVEAR